jgi:hypothetical protein
LIGIKSVVAVMAQYANAQLFWAGHSHERAARVKCRRKSQLHLHPKESPWPRYSATAGLIAETEIPGVSATRAVTTAEVSRG